MASRARLSLIWLVTFVVLGLAGAATSVVAAAENVLPNASFEVGFGEGLQTHWADYQNALTIKLTSTGQLPKTWPAIEKRVDAPDGTHAVRLAVAPDAPGHLPSPVVGVKPGHAYTLSVYARSDEPSGA